MVTIFGVFLTSTAFLEQILLDEAGTVRPRYRIEIEQQGNGNPHSHVTHAATEAATPSNPVVAPAGGPEQ